MKNIINDQKYAASGTKANSGCFPTNRNSKVLFSLTPAFHPESFRGSKVHPLPTGASTVSTVSSLFRNLSTERQKRLHMRVTRVSSPASSPGVSPDWDLRRHVYLCPGPEAAAVPTIFSLIKNPKSKFENPLETPSFKAFQTSSKIKI